MLNTSPDYVNERLADDKLSPVRERWAGRYDESTINRGNDKKI